MIDDKQQAHVLADMAQRLTTSGDYKVLRRLVPRRPSPPLPDSSEKIGIVLDIETTGPTLRAVSPGLTPEMAAAAAKLMSNFDLMTVGSKCQVVVRANNTLGLPQRLSSRCQPNHPTDDVQGILASMREGLSYGCGDAVIGVNPATEGAIVLVVTLLVLAAALPVAGIAALGFLFSCATAFFNPARDSIIPLLARREELVVANSLVQSAWQFSLVIGPFVAAAALLARTCCWWQ